MKKHVQNPDEFYTTTKQYYTSNVLLYQGGVMGTTSGATKQARAKISVEDVVLDETGKIHTTGDKDEYLLPPDFEKQKFEKIITESLNGQAVNITVENSIAQLRSEIINQRDHHLDEYLQKFMSIGLFIMAVVLAVWLNDKLKNEIGILATFLAGFIILSSSVLSILFLGLFSSRLQQNHD